MKKGFALLMIGLILLGFLSTYGLSVQGVEKQESATIVKYTYGWEMKNDVFTPIESEGYQLNRLTAINGTIRDGVLKAIRYSLEREIHLDHDAPWVIQWLSTGNWSGMLLSSMAQSPSDGLSYLFRDPGSRIFAFGEYDGSWNNYGMVLDMDMTVPHVFRLENRIAEDGSNEVVLLIDYVEMGTMDHFYVTSKDQNKRVNWADGKDIVYSFIGTSSHPMNGMAPKYLKIWEGGHDHSYRGVVTEPTDTQQGYTTYTCVECGYSYMDDFRDPTCRHIWGEWKEYISPTCYAEGTDIRVCRACGGQQYRDTRITGDSRKILVSAPMDRDDLRGKTILQIGDSITYGVGTTKTYGAYLAESLGVTVINKGVSGSGYCSGGRMTTNKTLTEANVSTADVVTILLGVNDWAWAVKDGSWNGNPDYYDKDDTYYQLGDFDSTDTSTFYGALHAWGKEIVRLKEKEGFEHKKIIVITPLITSWNNSVGQRLWDQDKRNVHGHTFREYCTAIMEVCTFYEIPVFDANMFSGIYYRSSEENNVDETGGDGVHVNANGHGLLAKGLEEFLLENYSYEDRSVLHGGHDFENGVCVSCRLPYNSQQTENERPPIQEAAWKMGHTLNLASDISVSLAIGKSSLSGFDMDSVYVLAELDVYEGNTKTGVKTVKILPEEKGSYYYFTLTGLTAVNMNNRICSVLYGTKDGQVYYSPIDNYSIADYAYAQMKKATASATLKTLCADLLRYGAKAQIFKNYRTDALADAYMTEEQKTFLSDMDAVVFNNTNTTHNDLENAPIKWEGKALDLASKVTVKFIFSMDSYTGDIADLTLKVSYEDVNGQTKILTLSNGELYNSKYNFYAFTLDSLLAAELRSVLSLRAYAGEIPVSCTLQYAADTYGNNKTGTLGDLCKALFAYSDSAKRFFAS